MIFIGIIPTTVIVDSGYDQFMKLYQDDVKEFIRAKDHDVVLESHSAAGVVYRVKYLHDIMRFIQDYYIDDRNHFIQYCDTHCIDMMHYDLENRVLKISLDSERRTRLVNKYPEFRKREIEN